MADCLLFNFTLDKKLSKSKIFSIKKLKNASSLAHFYILQFVGID